ncbi:hypothetical protein [Bradymonas sediminis]|uniref:Organic solvent tolerance-like N-terminal domain-containing protein n=1 Tax=Bradymonas sediminis TaxID=1548548 RepID=A0A2Z4FLA2_9DELT|nr:hypothetical protein [Bradymonas sediminis]AWV89787.1 hypothetical protein DN745_10740 [Bradymonas sediminis]
MIKYTSLVLALQFVGATAVWAQDTAASEGIAAGDVSLVDENIDAMSNAEKLSRGADKIKQMRGTLAQTNKMLENVRSQDEDIIRVNCVNEKVASMKGFVKVAEQSYTSLNGAVSAKDDGAAKHHYTLISVGGEKVRTLASEAALCTGEEMRFTGTTEINVETPDTVDDFFDEPADVFLVTDLPELTPYQ